MNTKSKKHVFISSVSILSLLLLLLLVSNVDANYLITPTLVPTKIPLPQPPQDLKEVQTLMMSLADCQLPCFWGFDPSHTTAKEILTFVQRHDDFSKLKKYDISYYFPTDDPQKAKIVISFSIENELLSALEVILDNPSDWLPEKTFELPYFLQQMSEIPDVYLSINNSQGRIFLELAYTDTGVVIQYPITLKVRGNVISPTVDEPYLLCPQLKINGPIHMWMQAGDGQDLVDKIVQPQVSPNHFWSTKQMTGLSTEAFIEHIVQHPKECVEMLSYPQLSKQGYEF
jgi:hypothetical protein